jgi:hypothetical protein
VLDYTAFRNTPFYIPLRAELGGSILLTDVGILVSPIPPNRTRDDPRMRENDQCDVGVCELTTEIVSQMASNFRFMHLFEIDTTTPAIQGLYMVMGYPYEIRKASNEGRSVSATNLRFLTSLCDPDPSEPIWSIKLKYAERDGAFTAPHPGGMSGCGIWRFTKDKQSSKEWKKEDAKLVAIQHTYNAGRKFVRGTSFAAVLSLIGMQWPELQEPIHISHPSIRF